MALSPRSGVHLQLQSEYDTEMPSMEWGDVAYDNDDLENDVDGDVCCDDYEPNTTLDPSNNKPCLGGRLSKRACIGVVLLVATVGGGILYLTGWLIGRAIAQSAVKKSDLSVSLLDLGMLPDGPARTLHGRILATLKEPSPLSATLTLGPQLFGSGEDGPWIGRLSIPHTLSVSGGEDLQLNESVVIDIDDMPALARMGTVALTSHKIPLRMEGDAGAFLLVGIIPLYYEGIQLSKSLHVLGTDGLGGGGSILSIDAVDGSTRRGALGVTVTLQLDNPGVLALTANNVSFHAAMDVDTLRNHTLGVLEFSTLSLRPGRLEMKSQMWVTPGVSQGSAEAVEEFFVQFLNASEGGPLPLILIGGPNAAPSDILSTIIHGVRIPLNVWVPPVDPILKLFHLEVKILKLGVVATIAVQNPFPTPFTLLSLDTDVLYQGAVICHVKKTLPTPAPVVARLGTTVVGLSLSLTDGSLSLDTAFRALVDAAGGVIHTDINGPVAMQIQDFVQTIRRFEVLDVPSEISYSLL